VRLVKGILALIVLYALINGGLWAYWKVTNGEEQETYAELSDWLDEAEEELAELEEQAGNAQTEGEYNSIVEEYDSLFAEYEENIDLHNEAVEVLDNEWYLLPIPLGKR
jgi:predicted nuclease with TOPRIM domain